MLQEFIYKDMEKRKAQIQEAYSGNKEREQKIEQIQSALSSAREITFLNPYRDVLNGPKWKVALKRLSRKLSWWYLRHFAADVKQSTDELIRAMEQMCVIAQDLQKENKKNQRNIEKLCAEIHTPKGTSPIEPLDLDYKAFEERFRGSEEMIRSRVQRYLAYFEKGQRVADLGCGRGEWLELLREKGVCAIGVDMCDAFIECCKQKNLNVVHSDMFEWLEKQEDCSLDGITSIQVIEHLTPNNLIRLIRLCERKLKIGGVLILETPNPAVAYTMLVNFYVDPTHERPVHPTWLQYLLETNNFGDIIMDYPEYAWVHAGTISHVPQEFNQAEQRNAQIDMMNMLMYGSTDYAAIARKSEDKGKEK